MIYFSTIEKMTQIDVELSSGLVSTACHEKELSMKTQKTETAESKMYITSKLRMELFSCSQRTQEGEETSISHGWSNFVYRNMNNR